MVDSNSQAENKGDLPNSQVSELGKMLGTKLKGMPGMPRSTAELATFCPPAAHHILCSQLPIRARARSLKCPTETWLQQQEEGGRVGPTEQLGDLNSIAMTLLPPNTALQMGFPKLHLLFVVGFCLFVFFRRQRRAPIWVHTRGGKRAEEV